MLTASPLIAVAATALTEVGDEPLLSASDSVTSNDARTALAASTQAAVTASARVCLDDRLVTRPNELYGEDGHRSRADELRAASLPASADAPCGGGEQRI